MSEQAEPESTPEMPKSKIPSSAPSAQDETATITGAEPNPSDEPRKPSLLNALKAVQASVWLLFLAALILVGGLGYLVGSNSFGSDTNVNLAGVSPGKGSHVAKPKDDGTYDASIFGPRPGTTLQSQEDLVNIHRRQADDPFALGAVDAPVVMSVFSDYECPFCAKFAVETEPTLIKDYVDAGLVRIEWNDLAINGDRAVRSAQAGRAAAAQGKFWEFNKVLFDAAAKKSGHPEFKDEDLIGFAEKAGVPDIALFKKQLDSKEWEKAVKDATEYGQGLGIQGTPQFLIGTTTVSGALPIEEFRDRIELELMKVARVQAEK